MAQNRDKEETENLPVRCTPPPAIPFASPQLPAARLPESPDPKLTGPCDPRTSSAASPDPVSNRGRALKRPREVTRCSGSGCRKRIGLMGFRCRCGDLLCSEHRYSDRHDCSFDYKAAGREAIARENPVIRAAKLLKV